MINIVWLGLVIALMLMILYYQFIKSEHLTPVVDPEQYVNSILTANY